MKKSFPKDSWCLSAESSECLTIVSQLTFISEGISLPKMLQHVCRFTVICDRLLAITGFLSATNLGKYFLPFHATTKFYIFLTWLRSLSTVFVHFFIGQFSFLAKIYLCLSATRINSLQNFVDQSLWLDSRL